MPKASKDRQSKMREKRRKAGLERKEYWATKRQHAALKAMLEQMKGSESE